MDARGNDAAGVVGDGEGRTLLVMGDRVICKTVGAETARAWSLFEITTPPGSAVPLHRHAWDEAYYVLDGTLEFQLASSTVSAGPGAFVRVRGGTSHSMRNATAAPARYLLWASPAGAEGFFIDLDQAGREPGFGLEKVLALAARHGIEALPGGCA